MNNTTTEILIAGFGGQGILFVGKLLAYFGLIDNKEVSWLPSYGPAMRGGTCNCSVCISDTPIGSPLILEPELLIAMNTPSYDKFIGTVKKDGKIFVDSTLVDFGEEGKCSRGDIECYTIPATKLALDNDMKGMANIIMLGKFLSVTKLCNSETIKLAIEKAVPPNKKQLIEVNLKAIKIGFNN